MSKKIEFTELPKELQDAFKYVNDNFEGYIELLGKYRTWDAYTYCYAENICTGVTVVYLYRRGKVKTVIDDPADEIIFRLCPE